MKKFTVLLILSGEEENVDDIKAGFIANDLNDVDIVTTDQFAEKVRLISYDLIIISCNKLNENFMNHLLHFSAKKQNTQFLVISKQISIYAYRQVGAMKNIVVLQSPFNFSLFDSVLKQTLDKETLSTRTQFPRFLTDEPARLIVMETGLFVPTRMRNYSPGGAFLEYKGISVRVGQNVKLNLTNQEEKLAKSYWQLTAQVIWTRDGESRTSSARGLGVKFQEESEAS